MAGSVLTYTPSDVKLTISGYTLPGIVSMAWAWNTPPLTMKRGIRGQNTRVVNPDQSATLTVEVLQTSDTNSVLFQILRIDRLNGQARLDLTLSDNSGKSVIQTQEAYITQYPDLSYSMGFNTRQWKFDILSISDQELSGSADQATDLFSSITGSSIVESITGLF